MPRQPYRNVIPQWMRPEAEQPGGPNWRKQHESGVVRTLRSVATALGLNDPQSNVTAVMTPMVPQGQETVGPVLKAVQDRVRKIRAFHGSPHDFDKFDLSKIGTGEGVQGQGRGVYLAADRPVGEWYRDVIPKMARHEAAGRQGHLYEVEINADPSELLDWDVPIGEQSTYVQTAIRNLKGRDWLEANRTLRGEDVYRALASDDALPRAADLTPTHEQRATRQLAESGVKGTTYRDWMLDGAVDGAPSMPRQYVIFDASLVSILKKSGVALSVIEGLRRQAAAQGGRVSSDDVNRLVQQ